MRIFLIIFLSGFLPFSSCTQKKNLQDVQLDVFGDSSKDSADAKETPDLPDFVPVDLNIEEDLLAPDADESGQIEQDQKSDESDDNSEINPEQSEITPDTEDEDVLEEEGPCIPNCKDKICGPDGCDSICGFCEYGWMCTKEGDKCIPQCFPDCIEKGKVCGDDGCKGLCGECDKGFICKDDFHCYKEDCIPQCENKVCGDDGCGKTCGSCAPGYVCVAGNCEIGECGDVKGKGKCDGHLLLNCVDNKLVITDCGIDPTKTCGWDPWAEPDAKWACIDKPPCIPDCTEKNKECGDDGCEGQCGKCSEGWSCPAFKCSPVEGAACGYISQLGFCWPTNVLYWCSGTTISSEDCQAEGKMCGWNKNLKHYACNQPQ